MLLVSFVNPRLCCASRMRSSTSCAIKHSAVDAAGGPRAHDHQAALVGKVVRGEAHLVRVDRSASRCTPPTPRRPRAPPPTRRRDRRTSRLWTSPSPRRPDVPSRTVCEEKKPTGRMVSDETGGRRGRGWVQCDRVFFIRASGFVKSRCYNPTASLAEMRWDPGLRVARARARPSGGRAGGDRWGCAWVGAGRGVARAPRADRGGGTHRCRRRRPRRRRTRRGPRARRRTGSSRRTRIAARRGRRVEQRGAFAVAAELGGRSHRRGGAPAVVARSAVRAMTRRPK